MKSILLTLMVFFTCTFMYAQTEVSGKVIDAVNNEAIPGVNVKIIGGTTGASTDFDGFFSINTTSTPPFTLEFTSVGYDRKTYEVTNADEEITVILQESQTTLDEVVVSASRTPERIFESPVTVETMSLKDIKNTASPDFYDGLENLKGVDINTNSLTFKSINTRGFSTFSNTRFMQLVDGM
ncbi:MAG: carboxypeptidase-like regulatory domain-containing protein, partial [Lutimonas sp.]